MKGNLVNGFGKDKDGHFKIRGVLIDKDIEFHAIYDDRNVSNKDYFGYLTQRGIDGTWKHGQTSGSFNITGRSHMVRNSDFMAPEKSDSDSYNSNKFSNHDKNN